MGTMSEVQHRQKIDFNIWVEDKNSVDYYLLEKQFINCFTSINVHYKTIYGSSVEEGHNFIVIPIEDWKDLPKNISNKKKAFSREHNIPVIIACGSRNILDDEVLDFWRESHDIPNVKIFANGYGKTKDDIILTPNYISKLYNWYGRENLRDNWLHSFNVMSEKIDFKMSVPLGKINDTKAYLLKELFDQKVFALCDSYWHTLHIDDVEEGRNYFYNNSHPEVLRKTIDEVYDNHVFHIDQHGPKDWWATYPWQYKSSCINLSIEDPSKQTITEHLLKSLMLGQPTLWVAYPKLTDYLEELGFSNYKWINYDFDYITDTHKRIAAVVKEMKRHVRNKDFILYVRKRTFWVNRKNKRNFNRLAEEDYCLEKFLEKFN